jgi:hypothetical protein
MDAIEPVKKAKAKSATVATVSLRVKRDTKRRVLAELAKVNTKDFGKAVRTDALISLALSLLNDQHIKALRDGSMTNADRLELRYRDYVKMNGATSKDEFIGQILAENVSTLAIKAETMRAHDE